MTQENGTLTNKMEDLFLSILRNVILIVLALSIIASIGFLTSALSDSSAKPKQYTHEKFDSTQLVNELKQSLQAPAATKQEEEKKDEEKKPQSPQKNPIEDEIFQQANVLVQFYKKYDFGVNPSWIVQNFKPKQRKQVQNLSQVYGDTEAAKLEYSKGQTKIYDQILLNPELNQLLDKKFKAQVDVSNDDRYEVIHEFANKVMDFYPEFHANQIKKKQEFDNDQQIEVAGRLAGAMQKFYIAGGIFASFLLISLILVLVKIERNLRIVKTENLDPK